MLWRRASRLPGGCRGRHGAPVHPAAGTAAATTGPNCPQVVVAEVLQEILQRYVAIDRRDAIQPAFNALLGVVDEVFPVEALDVEAAKDILLGLPRLSARDAVHLAVVRRQGVERILTFDTDFDGLAEVSWVGGAGTGRRMAGHPVGVRTPRRDRARTGRPARRRRDPRPAGAQAAA